MPPACIAMRFHILPKRRFPSIASLPSNGVELQIVIRFYDKLRRLLNMRRILAALCFLFTISNCFSQSPVEVRVDLSKSLGPFMPVYRWFGYDESNYTTTKNGQALLRQLHGLTGCGKTPNGRRKGKIWGMENYQPTLTDRS